MWASRQSRRKLLAHHEDTTAWQPVPAEFEGNRGFESNDFVAMCLCDGNGNTVGEHLGIVHSSRPKPKPKGATGQKPRYDMPSEIRIWTLRSDVDAIDQHAAASAVHYGDVVEIKSCIVLKLGSSLRTIASWTASAVSSPRLLCRGHRRAHRRQ